MASRNDPWMRLETVEHWAGLWGSVMIDIGDAGHINIDSGFGPWPQGLALLRALQSGRFQRRAVTPTPARRTLPYPRTTRQSAHATPTF
ncbi:serine hydrolase [Thiobaca trueperi]|uniref:Serine hydrolase n=1 Tax=Thiobaca trueperi TaxID=127458 RepID=A0A4R3N6Y2_9GAMM|nr:serine hydrolase [Thiobaca trueperi]